MPVAYFGGRNVENFQNFFKVSRNPSFGLLSLNPFVKSPKKHLENPRSRFESLGLKGFENCFYFCFLRFGVLFWFRTDFLTSFFVFLAGFLFWVSISLSLSAFVSVCV